MRPCHKTGQDTVEIERMSIPGAFNEDCVADYSEAYPDHYSLKGSRCVAPAGFAGRCGFSMSSQYNVAEKAAYAEACLAPW